MSGKEDWNVHIVPFKQFKADYIKVEARKCAMRGINIYDLSTAQKLSLIKYRLIERGNSIRKFFVDLWNDTPNRIAAKRAKLEAASREKQ